MRVVYKKILQKYLQQRSRYISIFKKMYRDYLNRKRKLIGNKIPKSNELYIKANNKMFPLKSHYNSIIPLNIFQTWHTKHLPSSMGESIQTIKNCGTEFSYELYDDNDCRNFIEQYFDLDVLNAFDTLIPGAYKADLWRYCVLYIKGGIYIDIKYKPINGFKFIALTEKEHWVLDADKNGIYNALIVVKKENQILLKAINQIVKNVRNNFYGNNCLEPTGPLLLANYFTNKEKQALDMKHTYYGSFNNRFILYNNFHVLRNYNGYTMEHNQNQKVAHYSILWSQKQIYKKINRIRPIHRINETPNIEIEVKRRDLLETKEIEEKKIEEKKIEMCNLDGENIQIELEELDNIDKLEIDIYKLTQRENLVIPSEEIETEVSKVMEEMINYLIHSNTTHPTIST